MSESRPARKAVAGLLALSITAACAGLSSDDALLVSVAVSLGPAIEELAGSYEAEHPGTTIRLNKGASGVLLQQIRRGAPVDLYISASTAEMDRLGEVGLIDRGSVAVLASNRLVLVTPAGTPAEPELEPRLDRFASIAVANPRTAPLGRYTRQALQALGVEETLRARAVLGESARQVIEYVARGEVEAGIVYRSDALLLAGRVEQGPVLDGSTHQPIAYCAVVPREASRPQPAADFLRHLQSAAGSIVLARHGFVVAQD